MTNKVLITGATGATGSSSIDRLIELGVPVRAMVHSLDDRSKALEAKGVEVVQGDFSDFDALVEALKGIAAAYFVYPIQVPGILEATALFAEAARENGVGAIVNMSQITARREAKSHAARAHWIAEQLLNHSGIATSHLRPTLFCEWIMYFAQAIKEQHILPLPFADGKYAPIAGEDQGRAIATILANPTPHAGKIYPLFGPRELTQYQIADMLTEVLGRKITYVPLEVPAFMDVLASKGFTSHFQQHMSGVAMDCRNGICSGLNSNIEDLTGQKPMEMADFIKKNKAAFV